MGERFSRLAANVAKLTGTYWAFLACVVVILVWAVSGPLFGFSDTWQLVINTGTTIVTFLMVFLIQNTQNRDAIAVQLKLDEVIRALESASNRLIDVENASDEELERLRQVFRWRAEHAHQDGVATDGPTRHNTGLVP